MKARKGDFLRLMSSLHTHEPVPLTHVNIITHVYPGAISLTYDRVDPRERKRRSMIVWPVGDDVTVMSDMEVFQMLMSLPDDLRDYLEHVRADIMQKNNRK